MNGNPTSKELLTRIERLETQMASVLRKVGRQEDAEAERRPLGPDRTVTIHKTEP